MLGQTDMAAPIVQQVAIDRSLVLCQWIFRIARHQGVSQWIRK